MIESEIYTGPDEPAFPCHPDTNTVSAAGGMTMREYYASHAPAIPPVCLRVAEEQAIEHSKNLGMGMKELMAGFMADWAFTYADAMLKRAQL